MTPWVAAVAVLTALPQADTLSPARVAAAQAVAAPSDTVGRARLTGGADVADALRTFAGVALKDYGGIGGLKTLNVRSLGSEHIGIYLDGIAVENAQNMQVDLGRFSTDQLRRIELYHGQRSAALQSAKEYGNAAAVYLITAPPTGTAYTVRLRGGSFGTFNPSFRADRTFRGGLGAIVSAGLLTAHGRYPFHNADFGHDTVLVRQNGDIRKVRADAQLFGPGWDLHAYGSASDKGLPGPVVRRPDVIPLGLDRQTDRDLALQGRWQRGLTDRWTLAARARYAYGRLRYRTDPEHDPQAMPYDNTYRQQDAYLSLSQHLRLNGRWALQAATDIQYTVLDANLRSFVHPHRWSFFNALAVTRTGSRLHLSASLLSTLAADRYAPHDAGAFSRERRDRHFLSPALIASYDIRSDLTLNAFLKRTCRLPSFNDLYYTLIGNADLSPETAWQSQMAARWAPALSPTETASLSVTAYASRVTDKIVALPTANAFRWTMANIGRADLRGAEVRAGLRHTGTVSASLLAAYAFQRATDRTDPRLSSYGGQIAYIPFHSGSFSAETAAGRWSGDIAAVFTGIRYDSASNTPAHRIAPWWTADLHAAYTLPLRTAGLAFHLRLRNLFNRQYEVVRGYPIPGTNFLLSAECTF